MTPKTASASVLPETCGMPQSSRTIVTFCASRSHAAAFLWASTRAHETPRAMKKQVDSHKKAQESQKCLDFISIYCRLTDFPKLLLDHEKRCFRLNGTGITAVSGFGLDPDYSTAGADVQQRRDADSSRALSDLPSPGLDRADVPHELRRGAP